MVIPIDNNNNIFILSSLVTNVFEYSQLREIRRAAKRRIFAGYVLLLLLLTSYYTFIRLRFSSLTRITRTTHNGMIFNLIYYNNKYILLKNIKNNNIILTSDNEFSRPLATARRRAMLERSYYYY